MIVRKDNTDYFMAYDHFWYLISNFDHKELDYKWNQTPNANENILFSILLFIGYQRVIIFMF